MVHKVSVILPCYNGTRWLSRAIESVLSQMYENFELVIVDDGSTDISKEIIAPYLSDKRVRYVYQTNRGFSAALNRGIRESSGDFIGFIGQDDLWLPDKLKLQIGHLTKHEDTDLVHSSYYSIDSEDRVMRVIQAKTPKSCSRQEEVRQLFLSNFIGFETVLVKKKCLDEVGSFDERMMGFSDHDMWLRIAGNFNIRYIDKPLVKKRQHNLQLSKNKNEHMIEDEFLIVEKAIDRYPFLKESKQRKLASLYYVRGIALLQKGNIAEAKKELLKTIRWQPWKIKAIAIYFAPTLYGLMSKRYQNFSKVPSALNWLEH